MKKLAVVLISLATALTGVVPAHAFPSVSAPKIETTTQVQQVDHRRGHRWHGHRRWRGHDRYYGHRHHRRHRHNNAGAIIGGLAAGAIIGGALAAPRAAPRYYSGGGNAHVSWCYDRYRSYRAADNTFQPYNGPRRQCRSPYY